MDNEIIQHKCMMCGTTELSRKAKTCGQNCRKAASRRHEAIKREMGHLKDALRTLERFSKQWPDLQTHVIEALHECVTTASVTLERVSDNHALL